ncbi:DoxX family protein [Actinomadura napierensis]|uniref:DoxX family membrane protein n=1 Tax=Actinomadura napierensis TaxID=267854 RepID=A0ABN2Y6I9_9ACTN
MRPIETLARPLVAAPFIMTGLEAVRDPRPRAEQVGPSVKPIADRIDWMPKDPETLVRIEGAISIGTGALLVMGRFRRLTTLLLAAQMVPTLATEHRYWTEDDPERRAGERSHLLKNAALFGALLMSATQPRRQPRTAELRRAVRESQIKSGAEAKAMRREAAVTLREARREAARQVRVARAEGGRKAAKGAAKVGGGGGALFGTKLTKASAKAGKASGKASGLMSQAGKSIKAGAATQAAKAAKSRRGGGAKLGMKLGRTSGRASGRGGALLGGLKLGKASGKGGRFGLKGGKAAGKAGWASGKATGMASQAGKTVKAQTAAQAARAAKAGKTVKAGTATQAAKAAKAGKTVGTGTAVQAGKVLQSVKH